ncbi:hypothetical protein AGMMS49950_10870 [Endomicrobiia bacterium]|nr:hypothetical protein AGMMS49950_10870 [Endomicrobiia bacterium]
MKCKKSVVVFCSALMLSCFVPTLGYASNASNKPKSRVNDFYGSAFSSGGTQWLRCPFCNGLHDRQEMIDCEKRSTQGVSQEASTTTNNVDNSKHLHLHGHLHFSLFGGE